MNRGVRAILVVVIALIAAGIATWAVFQAIQRMPVREVEVASQPVVVAAKALPVGALLGPDDVKLAQWPAKSPVAGAFRQDRRRGRARPDGCGRGERADHRPQTGSG